MADVVWGSQHSEETQVGHSAAHNTRMSHSHAHYRELLPPLWLLILKTECDRINSLCIQSRILQEFATVTFPPPP